MINLNKPLLRALLATGIAVSPTCLLADAYPEPVFTGDDAEIAYDTEADDDSRLDNPPLRPFSATYRTSFRAGWFSLDVQADRKLQRLPDNRWRITFNASASVASLQESSVFLLEDGFIQPLEYRYRASGMINEPNRALLFSAADQQITNTDNNRVFTDDWQTGIQDNLSYMLQASLDLQQGFTELSYPVFERHRTKTFAFRVLGEETLNTRIGSVQAIKVEQLRDDRNREILAWFSIDHGYQLVRLTDREKGKLRYQIEITSFRD